MTTLFVKARMMAFQDVPNLFALPQPNMEELVPVEEVEKYTKQEYTTRLMEACARGNHADMLLKTIVHTWKETFSWRTRFKQRLSKIVRRWFVGR